MHKLNRLLTCASQACPIEASMTKIILSGFCNKQIILQHNPRMFMLFNIFTELYTNTNYKWWIGTTGTALQQHTDHTHTLHTDYEVSLQTHMKAYLLQVDR